MYSLVKRPYVLDLLPDRSVVRSLLREGLSVYLADWLPPRPEDTARRLYDYIEEDLAHAVDCIRRIEGVDRISLVGCCLGGFLAAVYAALHVEKVERLMVFGGCRSSRDRRSGRALPSTSQMFTGTSPHGGSAAGSMLECPIEDT